jgi:NAD(P)-dependent dehydrogenase (short-subunit alcohol dehydrogenase family)
VTRVAVVTGGCSGMGFATAAHLLENGLRVATFDVAGEGPAGALNLRVDVADADAVEAGFAEVVAELGVVDVLVNNAGIGGGPGAGLCHESDIEAWDRVHAVNVRGPYLCSRQVLPGMMEKGYGQIVTISSIAGMVVMPTRCAYTASKGGALMFAKSLAVDYGPKGIRSNAICPGGVYTPMVSERIDAGVFDIPKLVPLGYVAKPADIAHAVYLLASGQLDYMNGSAWVIDGGWTSL